ncbi:MAG: barstar family protein [Thermoleophilia bacterium]
MSHPWHVLLTDPARGGVFHCSDPAPDAALRDAGWTVARMDGGHGRDDMLTALATALEFPAHFGGNLDALWDCVNDLERPTALVWGGWEHPASGHADDWDAVLEVLRDRAEMTPPFAVILLDGLPAR